MVPNQEGNRGVVQTRIEEGELVHRATGRASAARFVREGPHERCPAVPAAEGENNDSSDRAEFMKNIGVYSQYRVRFGEIRFSVDMKHCGLCSPRYVRISRTCFTHLRDHGSPDYEPYRAVLLGDLTKIPIATQGSPLLQS